LLVDGVATVRAQSALDGFDPNANGTINGTDVSIAKLNVGSGVP
jgi:hypothetical protein